MGMFAEPGDPLAQSGYGLDMDDPPPYESIIMDAPAVRHSIGDGYGKLWHACEESISCTHNFYFRPRAAGSRPQRLRSGEAGEAMGQCLGRVVWVVKNALVATL